MGDRSGHQNALFLASGQRRVEATGKRAHPNLLEGIHAQLAVGKSVAFERAPMRGAAHRDNLEVAAQLLTTTDLPLSQVARRCGLSSAETLRQAFVDRYGITPSRFRSA